jgi:low affinity Fe/Cu permease
MNELFRRFSARVSLLVGTAWAFILAVAIVVTWAGTGPAFRFSDTWQLVINTGTTIVTFLMVFLIQNTQNREARAFHLKLDELLKSVDHARNSLVGLEELSDRDLDELHQEFVDLQARAASEKRGRRPPSSKKGGGERRTSTTRSSSK